MGVSRTIYFVTILGSKRISLPWKRASGVRVGGKIFSRRRLSFTIPLPIPLPALPEKSCGGGTFTRIGGITSTGPLLGYVPAVGCDRSVLGLHTAERSRDTRGNRNRWGVKRESEPRGSRGPQDASASFGAFVCAVSPVWVQEGEVAKEVARPDPRLPDCCHSEYCGAHHSFGE